MRESEMSEFDYGADWQADLSSGDLYDGGHDAGLGDLGHFDAHDAHDAHDAQFGDHIDHFGHFEHEAGLEAGHETGHDTGHDVGYDELDHHFDHLDDPGHEDHAVADDHGDVLDFSGLEDHGIHGGGYDMFGADPHENDLWGQLKADMSDEVNPYVAH
jgi:hypothetical protein